MNKKFILGKKIGMTQIIEEDGRAIPITVVSVGPCRILKRKTKESDGYFAYVLGYEKKKKGKGNKPERGFFKKLNCEEVFNVIREFRVDESHELVVGDDIDVGIFKKNERVSVRGRRIGRGFAGTIKRHNFKRGPMTHGSKSHRITGSIGGGTTPGRVLKGKKMAGRHGNSLITMQNLVVVGIDQEKNELYIQGAIPGKSNNLVEIYQR